MRITLSPAQNPRFQVWPKWYAWRPVRLEGTRTWAWLEYVERNYVWCREPGYWSYRDIQLEKAA